MIRAPHFPAPENEEANLRRNIQAAHARGQIITASWHAHDPINPAWDFSEYARKRNRGEIEANSRCHAILNSAPIREHFLDSLDRMASFFKSLTDTNGREIPIIFRPFHEHTGGWFWWGKAHCQASDFQALWRLTVQTLRDTHGVHSLLYAYSPNQSTDTVQDYFHAYPGDYYVDLLGLDAYHGLDLPSGAVKTGKEIGWIVRQAKARGKIAALTETGLEAFKNGPYGGGVTGARNPNWFTQNLGRALQSDPDAKKIAYIMVWRNASASHYYFPAPWETDILSDFEKFRTNHRILLLNDWLSQSSTLPSVDGVQSNLP
jgi:mannan endo-1,4-beta-mannosidase